MCDKLRVAYLWWFERIVCRKGNVQFEVSTLVRSTLLYKGSKISICNANFFSLSLLFCIYLQVLSRYLLYATQVSVSSNKRPLYAAHLANETSLHQWVLH